MNEFIAWDKAKKKWFNSDHILIDGVGNLFIRNPDDYETIFDAVANADIYPYIGRTDRDGKKIYEGSIFKCYPSGLLYNIVYDIDMCRFIGKYIKGQNKDKRQDSFHAAIYLIFIELNINGSVIGHIAEGNHAD